MLVLTIIGGLIGILFLTQRSTQYNKMLNKTLDMSKYKWAIERYQTNKNVGRVDSKKDAVQKAKSLWLEAEFVDEEQLTEWIANQKIEVECDPQEEFWHIYRVFDPYVIGGKTHAIIRTSGEVMAVWVEE